MSKEGNRNKGITYENAVLMTGYIDQLIATPYEDRILTPPRDLHQTFQEAEAVYRRRVDKYTERSPGYDKRLKAYETLGRLLPSAPYVHLFWRIIDDHIDGDIDCNQEEIIALLEGVAKSVKGIGGNNEPEIMPMLRAGFQDWGNSPETVAEMNDLTLYGIKHMLEDPIRAGTGKASDQKELDDHLLHNTGAYFSQLYEALGLEWRAFSPHDSMIYPPAMRTAQLQALMQHLRPDDLEKDWNNGIKNVPKGVLEKGGLNEHSSVQDITREETFRDWALLRAQEAEGQFKRIAIRGILRFPQSPKAAIVIPAVSHNYLKIKNEVQEAYRPSKASLRID